MPKRWLANIAYYGFWLVLATGTWFTVERLFGYQLSAALMMTVFVLPMLLFQGYRDDLADFFFGRCREMPDTLWQLLPGDRTEIPGTLRWNTDIGSDGCTMACRSYVLDGQLILFNASLYDLAGFLTQTEFTRCIELSFPAACPGLTVGDQQKALLRRLAHWARAEDEVVFAGGVISLDDGTGQAYLYYRPRHARAIMKKASRIMLRSGFDPAVRDSSDPEWNRYLQSLIPDETTARQLYNLRRSTDWRCRGIDVNQAHQLYFFIQFSGDGSARPEKSEFSAHGYQCCPRDGRASLVLNRTTELNPQALNDITSSLQGMLEKYQGHLDGYALDGAEDR